ncbi:hypothetical protein ACFWP7_30885 [Streptomyces sp. NPDC058470]|uniref:hypothetical protein n=1 Tax=Streptomyces sp. NPDC058470 TaxID=3346515 RepID=UPI00364A0BA7
MARPCPDATGGTSLPRPQTDTLTADIVRLKKADRTLRSQHAAEQEARATFAAYANPIQALSLRNAELEAGNAHSGGSVRSVAGREAT